MALPSRGDDGPLSGTVLGFAALIICLQRSESSSHSNAADSPSAGHVSPSDNEISNCRCRSVPLASGWPCHSGFVLTRGAGARAVRGRRSRAEPLRLRPPDRPAGEGAAPSGGMPNERRTASPANALSPLQGGSAAECQPRVKR